MFNQFGKLLNGDLHKSFAFSAFDFYLAIFNQQVKEPAFAFITLINRLKQFTLLPYLFYLTNEASHGADGFPSILAFKYAISSVRHVWPK